MERHQDAKGAAAEDDPSKRVFDREKDMGSGVRIGNVQRQQIAEQGLGLLIQVRGWVLSLKQGEMAIQSSLVERRLTRDPKIDQRALT